jgi:hypothetical protein
VDTWRAITQTTIALAGGPTDSFVTTLHQGIDRVVTKMKELAPLADRIRK